MTTAIADTRRSDQTVRWEIVAVTTAREQRLIAHFKSAYPRLGETAISELYQRVSDSAARPVGAPGAWPGETTEGFERWLRLRVNAACLAEVGRPGLSKYVRAPETLDDLAERIGSGDTHTELEARDVWEHLAPKLHENERRYLMALAVCDNASDAREQLGWTPRQWRRWQESCNTRLRQLHANKMLGVLPLPLLARIWAGITPDRVAAATATGGAAASSTATLLGGAGTAKIVAGVAALTAAAGGVITAEHHQAQPKPNAKPAAAALKVSRPVQLAAPATTAKRATSAAASTKQTSGKQPPLATKKIATTDFKPAGGTAQKTRGGSSDFIPDGPTPVTKTYTPQASSTGSGSPDFAAP